MIVIFCGAIYYETRPRKRCVRRASNMKRIEELTKELNKDD